ncbi:hypothetical protein MTF68_06945 [Pseudoalteromonas sp. 2CM37A]|uniref:hypothetical protein n=1 Tax=Pseudoalteromonas sp. 2CM37A TaxID=2929853 RepID=UPI0020BE5FB8|nr:hypothetical protein [Pseudoalteromonas sp. 2CM37A]MCK8117295.1 hypothetical protein [Pseudoalteromonas sp. 2CM37A]
MKSTDKLLPLLRDGQLELHCINIKIWQEDGVELFGHGVIRINKQGMLYLEFICTGNTNIPPLRLAEMLPKDSLDKKDKLYLKCETLAGDILTTSNFSIELGLSDREPPNKKIIFLHNIQCEETVDEEDNFLYFDFSEYCDIPANRSNYETSTLGYESHSRNETIIEMDEFKISIIDKKKYTYCRVTGLFDVERVFECLKFYIGFTCGSMVQPMFTVKRNKHHKISIISSISNIQKRQRSSNPVPSTFGKKKVETDYHYQIFKNIYELYEVSPNIFESIYNQWSRVWYSFQSKSSITILTLSVAIEGLLNDIFIPKFKQFDVNDHLDEEISNIKSLVSDLNISPAKIERLKSSISYWKNITAAKSLDYLVTLGVVSLEEKRAWSKLRNSSAHPKTKDVNTASLEKERQDLLLCLNLFHNLVFNTLKYSGPRHYWIVNCNEPLRIIENIEINESSKQLLRTIT